MSAKTYVVANWKMHGTQALLHDWQQTLFSCDHTEVILCPPYPLLACAQQYQQQHQLGFLLGAQDCHWELEGAFTGEVSASILAESGVTHVLIGHSERRTLMGETDEYVRAKCHAAILAGLIPIVCIGETHVQYEAQETYAVLSHQLYEGLPKSAQNASIMVAYEPVWAIGTGLTPSAARIQDCHDHIRTFLSAHWGGARADDIPLLYGGSVKPENTSEIIACADVNGLLVGGASLVPKNFADIVSQCD